MVPLARAVVDAGHEVGFATARDFCPRVEQSGFTALPAGMEMPRRGEEWSRVLREMETMPPLERQRFGFCRVFAEIGAPAMIADLVRLVRAWAPDLLVHDVSELAGPIAATVAGIPYASHSFGHLIATEVVLHAAEVVAPLWREWGQEAPYAGGMYRHLYLDICPPSLQFPHISQVTVARQLRPVSFDAARGEQLPAWLDTLPAAPVVYVTLGTVFNRAHHLFQQILEGLRDAPVNVIVTVGKGADVSLLGKPPANVHIEQYIPQTLLFPRCNLVVSHGGSGTTLAALGHGIPLLTIPQGADQFRNAERCVAAGVGRALMPVDVSPEAIRRDVLALLEDSSYRQNAWHLKEEIDQMPSPTEVVALLEALVD
jgi:UDP:flavonoid glycosyltransferase YjiC (YdhE family)